jgi:hypothetical protein
MLFGKAADSLERSNDEGHKCMAVHPGILACWRSTCRQRLRARVCVCVCCAYGDAACLCRADMLSDHDLLVNKYISVPTELGPLRPRCTCLAPFSVT